MGSSHGSLLERLWLWIWSGTAPAVSTMGPAREALQLGALAPRTGPSRCSLIPQLTGLAVLGAPAWGGSCSASVRASSFLSLRDRSLQTENFLIPPDQFYILLFVTSVALLRTFHFSLLVTRGAPAFSPFPRNCKGFTFSGPGALESSLSFLAVPTTSLGQPLASQLPCQAWTPMCIFSVV